MNRVSSFLFIVFLSVSCWHPDSGLLSVNIDKALKKSVSIHDLCSQVDLVSLSYPGEIGIGDEKQFRMDVGKNRLFLLEKEKNEILVFDEGGTYLTSISCSDTIIDFSVYRDQSLVVLTTNTIIEYSITDCTVVGTFQLGNNKVTLKSVSRVDDDTIDVIGYLNGKAYDCGYLVNQSRFYSVESPVFSASEYKNSRFFHCNDSTFSFCTMSGEIDYFSNDDFIWPEYEWDFGKRSSHSLFFTNAQKMTDRIYLAFQRDADDYVLVYSLSDGSYNVIQKTKEGIVFPLGVIYKGYNYFCCQSSTLSDYLLMEMLDENGTEKYRASIAKNCPLVIKYRL